jgi:hypothetical protein
MKRLSAKWEPVHRDVYLIAVRQGTARESAIKKKNSPSGESKT